MKPTRIYGLPRLVGFAALVIYSSALYAQNGKPLANPGMTPGALCSELREGYTNFQECHSATQIQMCSMAQLMSQDPTQAQRLDAIMGELRPDKAIRLVEDFARKYPTSTALTFAYSFAANAYQQKGDVEKVAEYAHKSLKVEPDNLMSLILSVEVLPLPQYINKHPAERGKILRQIQNEADRALQLIPQIPKQPKEAEADYQKRLAVVASEVHGALGTVHLELASSAPGGLDKAELAKAEQEFQTAVTTTPQPDPRDYYRMGEAYGVEGKWDDAIQAFTKAGKLGQGTVIKTYANEQAAQLKKRKAKESLASNPSGVSGN
jgi:tetratricopeptide (TPR) repeat protein